MVRTQSIVSVSDAAKKAAANALEKRGSLKVKDENDGLDVHVTPSKNITVSAANPRRASPLKNTAGVNQGLEELQVKLNDQQRQMTDRLAKIQHTLDVMSYQQKERDSNSNINRDMVLLVVLVVMIQAMLNWVLTTRAQAAANGGAGLPTD